MASSSQLRSWWSAYRCQSSKMVRVGFPGVGRTWNLLVAREAAPLWRGFADLMVEHNYLFRESAGGTYNCLAGDTLVMTPDGEQPISDLAGTTATILTRRFGGPAGKGRWVEAPIRSYGVQSTWSVVLTRSGKTKEIRTTADHRWLVSPRGAKGYETTTADLKEGDRLASVYPNTNPRHVSSVGVQHGLVFGDGTQAPTECRAYLIGDTQRLLGYFGNPKVAVYGETMMVHGLPRSWKSMPSLDEGSAYMYGFLAGWFAADGDVTKKGVPRLWNVDSDVLEQARVIALRLGITMSPVIAVKRRVQPPGGIVYEDHVIYTTRIVSGVGSEFFLLDKHRTRWHKPKKAPAKWRVVSVEPSGLEEEVFCAEVAGTEAFALADNLLTGNCRKISGTNVYSLHSYGTAVDLNPSKNPYKKPLTHDYPPAFIKAVLAHRSNGKPSFRWGGSWSTPDAMHWEINVAPADIDQTVTEGDELLPLKYRDGFSDGRPGKKADVQLLQALLGIAADGLYGNDTAAAVAPYSGGDGKLVDGVTYAKVQQAAFGNDHDHDSRYLKGVKGIR